VQIKVLEVGQGDCLVLTPTAGCAFKSYEIFVDVGPGGRDLMQVRDWNRELIVLLSHAHDDHIGGVTQIPWDRAPVKQLWVPCYHDEIVVITRFITKLKGADSLPQDNPHLSRADQVSLAAEYLRRLAQATDARVVGCHEGMRFFGDDPDPCQHLRVYNPPLHPEKVFGVSSGQLTELEQSGFAELGTWFESGYVPEVERLLASEYTDELRERLVPDSQQFGQRQRRRFLYAFLLANRGRISEFVARPTEGGFSKLAKQVRRANNNSSVVLSYSPAEGDESVLLTPERSVLLTGDAELPVFRRLMKRSVDGSPYLPPADILKVPHHGSGNGINKRILDHIRPGLAIVSHKNGRFGRQQDPHPQWPVIKALKGIQVLYTNPVEKDGQIVAEGAKPGPFPGWEESVTFVSNLPIK
jgi:beta-lactamase superfamily II metal-dependent hydrolase